MDAEPVTLYPGTRVQRHGVTLELLSGGRPCVTVLVRPAEQDEPEGVVNPGMLLRACEAGRRQK